MIGAYQRVAEDLANFDTTDGHEIFLECLQIGEEVGKVLNRLFEFDISPEAIL